MNALATPQISTTTWNIDPVHSAAEFKVSPMMISNLKGQFARRDGDDLDADTMASQITYGGTLSWGCRGMA